MYKLIMHAQSFAESHSVYKVRYGILNKKFFFSKSLEETGSIMVRMVEFGL